MSMLTEFRDFALKGNVVDLAVGVIIGGAFGKIVDSMVKDIIMPIVGAIFGGLDFSSYFIPSPPKFPKVCPTPTRPTTRPVWPFWPMATSSPSS